MHMTRRQLLTAATAILAIQPSPSAAGQAPPRDERAQWNGIYTAADFPYKTDHNQFLAEVIKGRTPGTALDVGMGRGRNTLYLASQGWTATGVDIADEAVHMAQDDARRAGLSITAIAQDFDAFDVGVARWDLIAGIYMGDLIVSQATRLVAGLRPGGLLVVENFSRDSNLAARVGGGALGYTANQLLTLFAPSLRIRRYDDTVAVADWGRQGREVPVVRFAAEKG